MIYSSICEGVGLGYLIKIWRTNKVQITCISLTNWRDSDISHVVYLTFHEPQSSQFSLLYLNTNKYVFSDFICICVKSQILIILSSLKANEKY